jgi:hypothetical protein
MTGSTRLFTTLSIQQHNDILDSIRKSKSINTLFHTSELKLTCDYVIDDCTLFSSVIINEVVTNIDTFRLLPIRVVLLSNQSIRVIQKPISVYQGSSNSLAVNSKLQGELRGSSKNNDENSVSGEVISDTNSNKDPSSDTGQNDSIHVISDNANFTTLLQVIEIFFPLFDVKR